tara:strand:+ start:1084 stop:1500 length:417 start_codon:yes stop_codon:yes gene_type:complete
LEKIVLKAQMNSDKMAMSLSAACLIHCLFAPTLIIFAYSFLSFSVESEIVHYIILILALPISVLALTLGYRNHKVLSFLITGIFGLSLMLLAVLLGEGTSEKVLTVIGSSIVAYAHYRNHKICKELECDCHDKHNLSI